MSKTSEQRYINSRKRKAKITSFCFRFFSLLPINSKKISFITFEGNGGYCCNPRYISEQLQKEDETLNMVWLVNDVRKKFPNTIKVVNNTFFNRAYHLATSKVWISNARMEYGTLKRKGQFYIQTWHGAIAFKAVGKLRGELFPKIARIVSEYDSKLIDIVLSNSDWCTEKYTDMLLYDGVIKQTGSARCDVFFKNRNQICKAVREKYNIPEQSKIVLYAPTFRGGSQQGKRNIHVEEPTIDFNRVVTSLEKKFGGEWWVFLRLHPQLAANLETMPINKNDANFIDVSTAYDMNEILAACDVFITDYSSSAFDAINGLIPVFIYADDLEEYVADRGELMWDMFSLPFSTATSNEHLERNILAFDKEKYDQSVKCFSEEYGVLEDGFASKRVADIVLNLMEFGDE